MPDPTASTLKSDGLAAGIISLAQSILPFLAAIGVLDWKVDVQGLAQLVVVNVVTVAGLLFARRKSA